MYAVRWTKRNGSTAEFHYARRDAAEQVAAQLRRGWRRDAHVVTLGDSTPSTADRLDAYDADIRASRYPG